MNLGFCSKHNPKGIASQFISALFRKHFFSYLDCAHYSSVNVRTFFNGYATRFVAKSQPTMFSLQSNLAVGFAPIASFGELQTK